MLKFLVLISLVVTFSEAMPQSPWYNIGERVGLTWSNDQALTELGLPLNPRPLYLLQNIEATEKRKRRSANPEPINGGRGRWFIKGQRGSTVRWSNDQFLQDASLPVNPPGEEATG